jgi:TetR/AcrR family acrAB operon transcriptional repressor
MARKTKEEALETRNRIIDTAEHVFYRQGVSRTSLTDIATAAGVTRGAIYWHFKNKADLFAAMFDRVKLPLDELIAATLDAREPDPLGRIADVLVHCLRDTLLDPSRRRILDILFFKCEFTDDMGDVVARHQLNVREGRERLEGGLKNAIAKGQLHPDLDTHLATGLMHAMITGLLSDWLFTPGCIDLEGKAEQVVQACFDMLKTSPVLRKNPLVKSPLTHSTKNRASDDHSGRS